MTRTEGIESEGVGRLMEYMVFVSSSVLSSTNAWRTPVMPCNIHLTSRYNLHGHLLLLLLEQQHIAIDGADLNLKHVVLLVDFKFQANAYPSHRGSTKHRSVPLHRVKVTLVPSISMDNETGMRNARSSRTLTSRSIWLSVAQLRGIRQSPVKTTAAFFFTVWHLF